MLFLEFVTYVELHVRALAVLVVYCRLDHCNMCLIGRSDPDTATVQRIQIPLANASK